MVGSKLVGSGTTSYSLSTVVPGAVLISDRRTKGNRSLNQTPALRQSPELYKWSIP